MEKPRIKLKEYDREMYIKIRDKLRGTPLNTVCVEANCPNRYECFSKGTATFMILGDTCTRACRYCNVKTGRPNPVEHEARKLEFFIRDLDLKYVVITSVTRDDLDDGGASVFAECIERLKKENIKVEVLTPDFKDKTGAIETVVKSKPDVFNHNIEAVESIYKKVRPVGGYELSLSVLAKVKELDPLMVTKSGLMLGFGETKEEILQTLRDLREHGVDLVTIGQYLRPTEKHYPVKKFYTDEEFLFFEKEALKMGFKGAKAGKLVRSSYKAHEMVKGL